tara:strand:+ start:439 stop:579 length:141 start_codon:yes stop_codon:yes gene_type:complete
MMAVLASAVGKTTVKFPDDTALSAPKSNTNIAGLVNDIEVVLGVLL